MGRSQKYALDDFNVDVDFFESTNLEFISLRQKYGFLADAVYMRLKALIYKHGYYYEFKNKDTLCALIAQSCGSQFVKLQKIETVILDIVNAGLFDERLYQNNVLTSKKIQQYYLRRVERRLIKISEKYWLLNKKADKGLSSQSKINVDINALNDNINEINVDVKNTTKLTNSKLNNILIKNDNTPASDWKDFNFTKEKLQSCKSDFISLLKTKDDNGWLIDTYLTGRDSALFNNVIDSLILATRLKHDITFSNINYTAVYFQDIIIALSLNNLLKIVNVVKHAEGVKNITFYILGTVTKLLENEWT